jgi:type I restriction enzyme S subunit
MAPGVVTGRYGTLGEVFFIQQDYWPLNTSLYVSDFKGNRPAFAAYLLKQVLAGVQSDKAAVRGLNRNVAHQLPVLCSPNALRDRFADFADLGYRQGHALQAINERLKAARNLLLPRLMSGEIAV